MAVPGSRVAESVAPGSCCPLQTGSRVLIPGIYVPPVPVRIDPDTTLFAHASPCLLLHTAPADVALLSQRRSHPTPQGDLCMFSTPPFHSRPPLPQKNEAAGGGARVPDVKRPVAVTTDLPSCPIQTWLPPPHNLEAPRVLVTCGHPFPFAHIFPLPLLVHTLKHSPLGTSRRDAGSWDAARSTLFLLAPARPAYSNIDRGTRGRRQQEPGCRATCRVLS